MPIKLNTASGGGVILQGANTASDTTLTIPAVTATVLTDSAGVLNIGSGQVYKDASGNVGIGTSSPNVRTEVSGTEASISLRVNTQNAGISASNYSEVQLADVGAVRSYWRSVRDGTGATIFSYNDHLRFQSGSTERARIDSSGNLLVNRDTATIFGAPSRFVAQSDSSTTWVSAFNNTRTGTVNSNFIAFGREGTLTGSIANTNTATAYNTSSDYRLKENVQKMQGALAKVAALKPVTYTWKADGSAGEGFIAHELAEVVPGCVTGEKDAVDADGNPIYQGIDTSFLVATLTAAIQEQQAMIEELKAKVAALEAK